MRLCLMPLNVLVQPDIPLLEDGRTHPVINELQARPVIGLYTDREGNQYDIALNNPGHGLCAFAAISFGMGGNFLSTEALRTRVRRRVTRMSFGMRVDAVTATAGEIGFDMRNDDEVYRLLTMHDVLGATPGIQDEGGFTADMDDMGLALISRGM